MFAADEASRGDFNHRETFLLMAPFFKIASMQAVFALVVSARSGVTTRLLKAIRKSGAEMAARIYLSPTRRHEVILITEGHSY